MQARACSSILRAITIALVLSASGALHAQDLSVYGLIVSVRGDIYQIEPPYLTRVSRVLISDQTSVIERERKTAAILKPGMRLIGEGRRNSQGAIELSWMQTAASASTLAWRGPQVGVRADPGDGAGWFDVGGTIASMNPGTLTDDKGATIRFDIAPKARVSYFASGKKNVILIGQRAYILASRREGDILLAQSIFLQDNPGQPGTIFARIERISHGVMTVLPRFGVETMDLAIAPGAKVYRQIAVDPNSIHVGDTISIWAGHSADTTDMSQITAYILLPARNRFPASADVSADDPTAAGRTITGKVLSLSPLLLKTATGAVYTVTVPGQTPTARYVPSDIASVKPGLQTMLVCSQTGDKLSARTIVIDASPVVAMGL